jgi:hypothetical protein
MRSALDAIRGATTNGVLGLVPIMDILSNSHIHVSYSYDSPPFLSYRNEEGICLSATQCIVI